MISGGFRPPGGPPAWEVEKVMTAQGGPATEGCATKLDNPQAIAERQARTSLNLWCSLGHSRFSAAAGVRDLRIRPDFPPDSSSLSALLPIEHDGTQAAESGGEGSRGPCGTPADRGGDHACHPCARPRSRSPHRRGRPRATARRPVGGRSCASRTGRGDALDAHLEAPTLLAELLPVGQRGARRCARRATASRMPAQPRTSGMRSWPAPRSNTPSRRSGRPGA
jgi:hypothetical protein